MKTLEATQSQTQERVDSREARRWIQRQLSWERTLRALRGEGVVRARQAA
ncbi:MAG TPA: hypothetical protein VIC35_07385 [Acidimicrobiia bacterium]|jgi:hypothetical protein